MPEPTQLGTGLRKRIARQTREAALKATPEELVFIDRLALQYRCGAISAVQAQDALRALLRDQNARTMPQAA